MVKATTKTASGDILQNLEDAGCDSCTIEKCMGFYEGDQQKRMLPELKKVRTGLLENIHKEQDKLACLDYLIYQLER